MKGNIYIVGAGGVGSWLAPSVSLLTSPKSVTLVDGDTLEEKNLNRQLFTRGDIGRNKAEALAMKYECHYIDEWFSVGTINLTDRDWLLVCVDNNPARLAALQSCDSSGCHTIVGANEVHSAEAYYYQPAWRGTRLDPRVYYPDIVTDHSANPLALGSGCTGAAQENNRQLASANFMAAALVQHLFVLWAMEAPGMDKATFPMLPYQLKANLSRLEYFRVGNLERTENDNRNDTGSDARTDKTA